jgi:PAS domain S-box-containing protein
MDGVSRYSWFRSARSPGVLLVALIVLLGVGGYLLTSTTIRDDRDGAAARRAQVEAVHAQEVLGRARAYVGGLAEVLAGEPEPGQAEFARWAGATSASVGLNEVLWVERVPASERGRYERLRGVPITHLTATGRSVPAPPASSYMPATFTSETRPELRPGVDVGRFPGLGAAIRDRARIFAVGASRPGALGSEPGFYLLQAATFARGPGSRGYLVAFVPRGWFTTTLGGDPRRVAISEDGKTIEGALDSVQASAGFEMLGRNWRIDVAREPPSGLQSLLPWIALAWPFAVAGIAFVIGRAITQRRRAQREVERIFEMSLDMICIAGFDGRFKAVNPAFERTLGYSPEELLERPLLDFVQPDDRQRTSDVFADILSGNEVTQFENRYICKDGSERWLQWSSRSIPDQKVVYAIARDVTESRRITGEQAALRRVATLVAEGVEPSELFTAVTREVAHLFADVDPSLVPSVIRFDPGPEFVLVGAAKGELEREVGSRYGPTELFVSTRVLRTGATARVDEGELDQVGGRDAELLRREGFLHQVGSPIVVEGRPWGAITINSASPLPSDAGERLENFTELVATAIANTESREGLRKLADEQAALRRVATLVAEGRAPGAILDAVTGEMEGLLGADQVALNRFEPGDEIVVLAHRGLDVERTPVGSRVSTAGESVTATVRRTGRPARMEGYESAEGAIAQLARETGLRSSVSAPIMFEGRPWGVITASWKGDGSPPPDTEHRMVQFAALLDSAIANAEARTEIERLAEEQAALRRVATLVAEGAPASSIFDAVAAEMGRVLGADGVTLNRYEASDEVSVLAHSGSDPQRVPLGTRVSHRGENVTTMVRRSKRPARMEHREGTNSPIVSRVRGSGVRASVGAPIIVEGQLWGVAIANWRGEESAPPDTESRMAQFAGLLDTAIANADGRDQLAASRARLVTAGDEARRRVVRDLHDGGQQRLVHAIVTLKLAQRAFAEPDGQAEALVGEALQHAELGHAELRELAHGILPAALTRGGLRAGIDAVVSRLDLPVRVDVPPERFPAEIEASAYFIVAEALTNVVKHSHATRAEVRASVDDGRVHVEVQDDGIGGADPGGHGLVGMADRVTALGGRLTVESPPGNGTLVVATLSLPSG